MIAAFGRAGRINGAKWVKLPQGFALEFNGSDAYIDCGAEAQLDLRGPLTMMAWICPAGVQAVNEPAILGKDFNEKYPELMSQKSNGQAAT